MPSKAHNTESLITPNMPSETEALSSTTAVLATPQMPAKDEERGPAAEPEVTGLRRSLLHFYMLQIVRIWTHLPSALRTTLTGHAFGRHVHTTVSRLSDRRQYVATYFLRNRPEMELICRLLGDRPHGSTVNITVLACSKGAEVYSIAWAIRTARPDLRLRIHAIDIDEEIVDFAQKGVYSRTALLAADKEAGRHDDLSHNTRRDQGASIFERMTAAELEEICEVKGEWATIRPWLREGITWLAGDAGDPEMARQLGPQDLVVANRFLCHMTPGPAESCLRNIARLVVPGGYLFVTGIDLDVRAKVARALHWRPVLELMQDVHEGDASITASWPMEYWAMEPFRNDLSGWQTRYASAFQIGRTQ